MIFNPFMGFQFMVFISLIFSLSSSSVIMVWIALELNMLSFLPLMSIDGGLALENTMKYFLIQSIASVMFLCGSLLYFLFSLYMIGYFTSLAILMKLGAVPFHGWFLSLLKTVSAWILFFLSSVQKFIPLMILSQMNFFLLFYYFIILLSVILVLFNGLGVLSLNKVLGLSSINNLVWMLTSILITFKLTMIYIFIYSILLMGVVLMFNQIKIMSLMQTYLMSISNKLLSVFIFMSLGGMPPFLGFLGKLFILKMCMSMMNLILILLLILSSLVKKNYYLSLSFYMLSLIPSTANMPKVLQMNSKINLFFMSLIFFNILMIYKF